MIFFKSTSSIITSSNSNFSLAVLKKPTNSHKLNMIYSHSFNQKLFKGTLNSHVFGKYLLNDYIYLNHLASSLSYQSRNLNFALPKLSQQLANLSNSIVAGEQHMQREYAQYFSYDIKTEPDPAMNEYLLFLTKYANHPQAAVSLSSIFPCFWIYYQLGINYQKESIRPSGNPYENWLKSYTKVAFVEATLELEQTLSSLSEQSDQVVKIEIEQVISQAISHELAFFNEVCTESTYQKTQSNLKKYA